MKMKARIIIGHGIMQRNKMTMMLTKRMKMMDLMDSQKLSQYKINGDFRIQNIKKKSKNMIRIIQRRNK